MQMVYIPHLGLSAPIRSEHSTCVTVWMVLNDERFIPDKVLPGNTWMILGRNKIKVQCEDNKREYEESEFKLAASN